MSSKFPGFPGFSFSLPFSSSVRSKWAVIVGGCGPRFLVSEETWAVIPSRQRKQKLCFPHRTAKWLSWANLCISSVTCFISLPCNYLQREKLPLHIFIHIIHAWGLGLERLNLRSVFAAKMLQSARDKINSFLLSENSKLFINKEKKVPDLSPSCLMCGHVKGTGPGFDPPSPLSIGHFV